MRQSVVSVVAGGWSVVQLADHHLIPGYCIAINDSAFYLKRPVNEIVSMDRLWTEARIDKLQELQINTYLRRSTIKEVTQHKVKHPWFHLYENDNESWTMADDALYPDQFQKVVMTDHPYTLNGTNSGMVGINRAYRLKPRDLYLFGFDMQYGPNSEKHWYPDYPWSYTSSRKKLHDWAGQFQKIAKQFEEIGCGVYNVNNRSRIKAFGPQIWIPELEEIRRAA